MNMKSELMENRGAVNQLKNAINGKEMKNIQGMAVEDVRIKSDKDEWEIIWNN